MERSPPGGVQEVIGFPPRGIILHIFKVAVWRLFYFTVIYRDGALPARRGARGHRFPATRDYPPHF
jgi:hypothetical protein